MLCLFIKQGDGEKGAIKNDSKKAQMSWPILILME